MDAQPGRGLGGGGRRHLRLRQPGGRGQPQRGAHGGAAGGSAARRVPGTTINRLCGSGMDAVVVAARAIKARRGGADDRRRRGEHVARTVRHAQGGDGLLAQRRDLRHHHRLALRQSGDEGRNTASTRCPRRRRTWPRSSRSRARIRMPSLTAPKRSAGGGDGRGSAGRGDRAGQHSAPQGRSGRRGPGRASAPGHRPRKPWPSCGHRSARAAP